MSKIQKIRVTNFKAIGELEIDFKGCTAIITGGNNLGKSSFARGLMDRLRGIKPEIALKQGEEEGSYELHLTTGEKFIWEFTKDDEKLKFITDTGYKTKVTRELISRFFPVPFDIDEFINMPPKEKSKKLQKLVGLDFTDIDKRYKEAYDERTRKNHSAEHYHAKLTKMLAVPYCAPVDITQLLQEKETERTRLNELYKSNQAHNFGLRKEWNKEKDRINDEVSKNNEKFSLVKRRQERYKQAHDILISLDPSIPNEIKESLNKWFIISTPDIKFKVAEYPAEPEYIPEMPDDTLLQEIDKKLLDASEINSRAKEYQDYIEYKKTVEDAQAEAEEADKLVKSIEEERKQLIETANMPTGISFGEEGILVDGFPLDNAQISTSKKYCAALRIGSMNLGEVHAIHFDASAMDKNTLAEIHAWAQERDLQLLIERADYDAGEITYELIEQVTN